MLTSNLFLLLIVPTILLALFAQMRVSSAYRKNVRIPTRGRLSGAEAAQAVMESAGIHDVEIVRVPGHLTDHYDPTHKRLALSEENYYGTSLAAVGVAAHEAGHAVQHKVGYSALKARMSLVPVTQFASQMLPFVMLGGFVFQMTGLINLGILCYLVLTLFHLVTLPVEFDASRRAKAQLVGLGVIERDEMPGVAETLNAAALTYVAAFVSSLAHLLYLVMLRDRD